MSSKRSTTTGKFQGFYGQRVHSPFPVTPQPMPRVEHQNSQRLVRLSDLNKHSGANGDKLSSWLSSLEPAWVHKILGRRRVKKNIGSANVNRTRRSMLQPQELGEMNGNPHGSRSRISSIRSASKLSSEWQEHTIKADEVQTSTIAHPSNNPRLPLHSISGHLYAKSASDPALTTIQKPVSIYQKRDGKVSRHEVMVSLAPVVRKSIHLAHTPSNNYQAKNEPRRFRNASHLTSFGDFINTPRKVSKVNSHPPLPKPLPIETPDHSNFYQLAGHNPEWNISSEQDNVRNESSNLSPSGKRARDHEPILEHQVCSLCGTPNSPCTHYTLQGLWLCTACRSPTSAIEFPPRKASIVKPAQQGQQSQSSPTADARSLPSGTQVCKDCHTSLPPNNRNGIPFCSWCCRQLSSAKPRKDLDHGSTGPTSLRPRRYKSLVRTQDAEEEWENFDLGNPYDNEATTPPNEERSQQNGDQASHWPRPEATMKPTPPLKDSVYLSKKQSVPTFRTDIISLPPTRIPPPPPSSAAKAPRPQTISSPDRASFSPDTPVSTPRVVESPPLRPKIPPPPSKRQFGARKTSSVYPPTPNTSIFATVIQAFPYPPPPIPEHSYTHRMRDRAGKAYIEDPVPRLGTPDWEKSPKRNTSFYDYWEIILGDDGKRYTILK